LKFDSIVSNNPDARIKQKPHPDSLLICLQELNVKSKDTIYVGNSGEDVEAAIAAKVRPVVILREPVRRFNYDKSVELIYSLHQVEDCL
jgi:beta-phosphoglucomutase-like phosphatase (HAD superfamily)